MISVIHYEPVNRQIIARSITDLTYEGLEKSIRKKYLFIGNIEILS